MSRWHVQVNAETYIAMLEVYVATNNLHVVVDTYNVQTNPS